MSFETPKIVMFKCVLCERFEYEPEAVCLTCQHTLAVLGWLKDTTQRITGL